MMPPKKTVTVEDLIRLKRAERPPVEFWNQFEREMRVKQLAAIVEPRPWWAPLIRARAKFVHYQMPVGAAAVLAFTFVAVRSYHATDMVSPNVAEVEVAVPELNQGAHVMAAPAVSMPSMMAVESASQTEVAVSSDESIRHATQVGQVSHTVPLPDLSPTVTEPTPSARYIAANLAAAQAADPRLVDDVFGMPVRSMMQREPMRDPLAQIGKAGDTRRSRLLESALPVSASANVAVGSSDRVARRLTEERLYDTISRIGVQGDRVAFKF